ncbi:MAG: hypothetical protein DCC65_07345 [Planctomycetota bacterium]|nr:MAG: hypothetical protein DCC65_07345 [Planctomycetota bacterium]
MTVHDSILSQYRTCLKQGGWFARPGRGLLEVSGADRAAWLNNLVTNVIKTLQPGEGNYAFAVNVKGRVVFDLNMLVLEDRIWLDMDSRVFASARAHLDRFIITEDVRLVDISDRHARLAVIGPSAPRAIAELGLENLTPMSQLQHRAARVAHTDLRMIRHDLAGLPGAELILPADQAAWLRGTVAHSCQVNGMAELGPEVFEILRIEAGIPASVDDIDDEVVPPETGQIERGISYHKGCYLGQEVIERMRSHGILARQLVGLRIGPVPGADATCTAAPAYGPRPALPAKGALLRSGEKEAGRVTSACFSVALSGPIALGYVKSGFARPGTTLTIESDSQGLAAEVISLPVRKPTTPNG